MTSPREFVRVLMWSQRLHCTFFNVAGQVLRVGGEAKENKTLETTILESANPSKPESRARNRPDDSIQPHIARYCQKKFKQGESPVG